MNYSIKEFRPGRWHIIDKKGKTVYNRAPFGNDKPLRYCDEDEAWKVAEALNENQEIDLN